MTTTNTDVGGEWDSKSSQILPPGYYKAAVKSAEAKVSQSGNKTVALVLEIEGDEYAGVAIYHYLVFRPEPSNFNNKKREWFQKSAGLQYSLNDDYLVVAKQIVNRKVIIKVKPVKDNQGKDRNDVCGVHPYSWMIPKAENLNLDLGDDLDNNFL